MLKQTVAAIAVTIAVFFVINVVGDLAIQPQMAPQTAMTEQQDEDTDAMQESSEAEQAPAESATATPEPLPELEEPTPTPDPKVATAPEVPSSAAEPGEIPEDQDDIMEAMDEATDTAAAAVASAGDVDNGEKIFRRKCKACHTAEKDGRNMTGPNLWNIVGRERGTVEDFRYSSNLENMGGTWSEEDIKSFIAGPRSFIPDTKMTFAGLKKESEREDVLAYLKTLQD